MAVEPNMDDFDAVKNKGGRFEGVVFSDGKIEGVVAGSFQFEEFLGAKVNTFWGSPVIDHVDADG
jgi:hypothetical protein